MKKVGEILISTCIMWLPVVALVISNWLSQVITGEMIIAAAKIIGIGCVAMLVIIEILSRRK